MSITDLWDRIFWALIVAIFVGLVWLKYVDHVLPCVGPGLGVAAIAGGIYFYPWWRKARRAARTHESTMEGE